MLIFVMVDMPLDDIGPLVPVENLASLLALDAFPPDDEWLRERFDRERGPLVLMELE